MSNDLGFMLAFGTVVHATIDKRTVAVQRFDPETGQSLPSRNKTETIITFPAFVQTLLDTAKQCSENCESLQDHIPTNAEKEDTLIWAHLIPGGEEAFVGAFLYCSIGGMYDVIPEYEYFSILSQDEENRVKAFLHAQGIPDADIAYHVVNASEWGV